MVNDRIGEPLLQTIVQRLLVAGRPQKIILFGSQALGQADCDSDYDYDGDGEKGRLWRLDVAWGIMDAFHGIGMTGSANLGAVAPGIAEALITTAAGLAVAIPGVIAYNYFLNRIKRVATRMDLFGLEFLGTAERIILRAGRG